MKNVEKKKTLKEKIFKPMDKKYKDIFTRFFVVGFIFVSIVNSYLLHWVDGLATTFMLLVTFYFLFCPYKAAKSDKPDKAAKSDKPDKAAKSDKSILGGFYVKHKKKKYKK